VEDDPVEVLDDPYGLLGESSENGVAAGNDDEGETVVTPPAESATYPASRSLPPDVLELSGPVMMWPLCLRLGASTCMVEASLSSNASATRCGSVTPRVAIETIDDGVTAVAPETVNEPFRRRSSAGSSPASG
jgi:hypothetical protein